MTSTCKYFDSVLFLLSSLVIAPISSLVLELWQFSFIRDCPEIWKSEIPPSDFCSRSRDWGELWIILARMSNRMLLNAAKFQGYSFNRCQICQIDKTMKNLPWIQNTIVSTSMLALFWSFHFLWCQNWFI